MTALSLSPNTVIQPPTYEMGEADEKKFFYDVWARTGGYNSFIPFNFIADITSESVDSTPTILSEFAVPANILKTEFTIDIQAFGIFAANANNKSVKLYFGDAILIETTLGVYNGKSWSITATILPVSFTSQNVAANLISDDPTIGSYSKVTTHTIDATVPFTVNVTGTGVQSGDVVQYGMLMKWSRKR